MSKNVNKYLLLAMSLLVSFMIGKILVRAANLNSSNLQIWVSLAFAFGVSAALYFYKKPIYALSAYFVFSPFINNIRYNIKQLGLPAYFPEFLLIVFIIFLCLVKRGKILHYLISKLDKRPFIYITLFSAAIILSAVFSSFKEISFSLLPLYFTGILVLPATLLCTETIDDVKIILYGLMLGGLLGCIFSGYKILTAGVGFDFNLFVENTVFFNSIRSLYGHPCYFQLSLVVCLPILFYYLQKENNKHIRTCIFVSIPLFMLFILLSYERGGWLAALFIIVLMLLRKENRTKPVIIMLIVGMVVLFPFITSYFNTRVKNIAYLQHDYNIRFRFLGWQAAFKMLMLNPVYGVGIGSFRDNFVKYAGVWSIYTDLWHAHNMLLNIAAETGLFGLLPFILLLIRFFKKTATNMYNGNRISYYTMVSMSAFLLYSMTTAVIIVDFQYWNMTVSNYLWLIMGITINNVVGKYAG